MQNVKRKKKKMVVEVSYHSTEYGVKNNILNAIKVRNPYVGARAPKVKLKSVLRQITKHARAFPMPFPSTRGV